MSLRLEYNNVAYNRVQSVTQMKQSSYARYFHSFVKVKKVSFLLKKIYVFMSLSIPQLVVIPLSVNQLLHLLILLHSVRQKVL